MMNRFLVLVRLYFDVARSSIQTDRLDKKQSGTGLGRVNQIYLHLGKGNGGRVTVLVLSAHCLMMH